MICLRGGASPTPSKGVQSLRRKDFRFGLRAGGGYSFTPCDVVQGGVCQVKVAAQLGKDEIDAASQTECSRCGENAGPSTALRFAQDDTFVALVIMQVLRLRCASLRMTLLGWAEKTGNGKSNCNDNCNCNCNCKDEMRGSFATLRM